MAHNPDKQNPGAESKVRMTARQIALANGIGYSALLDTGINIAELGVNALDVQADAGDPQFIHGAVLALSATQNALLEAKPSPFTFAALKLPKVAERAYEISSGQAVSRKEVVDDILRKENLAEIDHGGIQLSPWGRQVLLQALTEGKLNDVLGKEKVMQSLQGLLFPAQTE